MSDLFECSLNGIEKSIEIDEEGMYSCPLNWAQICWLTEEVKKLQSRKGDLIQEITKTYEGTLKKEVNRLLQKEIELSKIIGEHVDIGEDRIKQNESLTKERDCYKEASTSTPQLLCKKISRLEAENAELKDKVATSMDLLKDWDDDCADLQRKLTTSEKAHKKSNQMLIEARLYLTDSQKSELDCLFDPKYLNEGDH